MTATLEFRGLDLLSAIGAPRAIGLRIQIVRGFLVPADVRGSDYVVAARTGRMVGNRISDVLTIGLAGSVTAANAEDWQALRLTLLAAITEGDGIDPGILIARGPYLGLPAGQVATITARVKNAIEGPVEAKLRQTWSIELESVGSAWTVT